MGRSGSHNLTRENLDKFLARLDPDRERAGEKYQTLRHKLVKLFEWRRASCAEDLADQTIDRVIGKLSDVEIHDVSLYVLGVGRNVLKESTRDTFPDKLPAEALLVRPYEDQRDGVERFKLERRLECLEKCMRTLPEKERSIITGYYREGKSEQIRCRREMAEQFGLSLGALRVQAHRIRGKLATCVDRCLGDFD